MNKSRKTSVFKASLLAALLSGALSAQAAGLGKLTVYSAIGQPLNAEVALTASPEEMNSISARLASSNAFKEAGIELVPALTGLRFSVVKSSSGQPLLRLSTDSALNEPFLHFLLELSWATGRIVREYTFLLDPPEMLQVAKPASVVAPASPAGKVAATTAVKPAPQIRSAQITTAPTATEGDYQVKKGDTLGKIASAHKPDSVSLDQMLAALFNANRDAFIGGNINRLRSGKILRMPDADAAAALAPAEARKLVISHNSEFNAYRRRLAEAAGAAPVAESTAQQQASGKIKPQVESKAPAATASDKLEVSKTEAPKAAKGGKSSLEEDLVARDKQLREASERIAQLEKNLENLKKLAELKSQSGSQLQQQAEAAKPATQVVKPEAPAAVAAKPAETAPPAPAPAVAPESPAAKPVEQAAKPAEALPKAADQTAKTPEPPAAAKPAPAEAPAAKKPVPPPPEPEPDFVADNPEIVYGGGGLLALLLGYFAFASWRKKKQAASAALEDDVSLMGGSVNLAPTPTATLGAADSTDVSVLGGFSHTGGLTTEEAVDPVAEADVLMAYGRDAQAEEILLEGIKEDPTRGAIHLKLLELYVHRQDKAQFESVGTELFALSNGQGDEWDKAVALAKTLGVTGGVFASFGDADTQPESLAGQADNSGTVILDAPPLAEPEPAASDMDFDLDLGTSSAPAAEEPAAPAPEAPAAEGDVSLDFDFDLDGASAPAVEVAAPVVSAPVAAEPESEFVSDVAAVAPVAAPAVAEPAATSDSIDFDLDLGSTAAPAAAPEPAAVPVPSDEAGVDFDFDMDLGTSDAAAPAVVAGPVETAASSDFDLGEISLDLGETNAAPGLDVDLGIGTPAPVEAAAEAPAFDLDLGLDIGSAPVVEPTVAVVRPAPAAVELPDIDLALDGEDAAADIDLPAMEAAPVTDLGLDAGSVQVEQSGDDDPEVATKLELAQAYEEMGDREGARELLSEVLNEGSANQQSIARSRLEQLGA